MIQEAKSSTLEAEALLLSALGLEQWQPPESLTYERSAKDVMEAGRLDSEHFKVKYADVWLRIKHTGLKTELLVDVVDPIIAGIGSREFSEFGKPYIRVGDIKKMSINSGSSMRIKLSSEEIYKDISLEIGDILFTRKGSFGNAAVVKEENLGSIISTEIIRMRIKKSMRKTILPEYVALFFNSLPGKPQSEQWAHGVAFFSVTQEDLLNFKIPIIDMDIQISTRNLLYFSEVMNRKANQLLEISKRAVELAIEQSEAVALAYLKAEVRALEAVQPIPDGPTNAQPPTL